ncbi:MAG: DEAD/DEAH box helicase family protein [Saprospiraceae bacterium]|nr:DEAD/DEAH box helicase family protein [Saprospiraceae bacterium]
MILTPHQAQYFAYELTRQRSGKDRDKLTSALLDAQVELTPHQVEAALFAFRSPLSQGVILADEVGLGKTIEAGLVIAQKWAERRRKILVIVPANLRKQWSQELLDKFFLPSIILEARTYKEQRAGGIREPFNQTNDEKIVICSYHYARAMEYEIRDVEWDLVVLDEAHKLRNVYRTDNKIGRAIRDSIQGKPKILLTATPLQNSLLELYGLVSLIDEYIFGDLKSFKIQFSRLSGDDARYEDLRQRLAPICQRTLRSNVLQYVKYTNRHALTEDYFPGDDEMELYHKVSEYLQRDNLYALPAGQRQLMTLILRRLLASSTFAISGTFDALANKLQAILDLHRHESIIPSTEEIAQADEAQEIEIAKNFEDFSDVREEWLEYGDGEAEKEPVRFDAKQLAEIQQEKADLEAYAVLAKKIDKNAKGEHLLAALEKGFKNLQKRDAPEKAIIFTESTRTQNYILEHLEKIPQFQGKIVLFNGTNNDKLSNQIYREWSEANKGTDRVTGSPSADKRAAIVERFAHPDTKIMIATEAGAEGINLQFCAFIINYDLPWNPQRVEQRIGRCHRYGQKHDVVVLNFINRRNAADERVYRLLEEKFKLFEGVFGASDEVLGAIESGVDFERRILQIFQECRNDAEINQAFDKLREELSASISTEINRTRHELLENLDAAVVDKVRIQNLGETGDSLDKYHQWLWDITRYALHGKADFEETAKSFRLRALPGTVPKDTPLGLYRMLPRPAAANPGNQAAGLLDWLHTLTQKPANTYRAGHSLAQAILEHCKDDNLPLARLEFQYDAYPPIAVLQAHVGQSGWMRMERLRLEYNQQKEDQLLFAGLTDAGEPLDADQCRQMLRLAAVATGMPDAPPNADALALLDQLLGQEETEEMKNNQAWLNQFYEREQEKMDRWVEDRRQSIRAELKDLETSIKQLKTEARKMLNLQNKVAAQRTIKELESRLAERKFRQFEVEKEIETKKDAFLDDIEARIRQAPQRTPLFTLRWSLLRIAKQR